MKSASFSRLTKLTILGCAIVSAIPGILFAQKSQSFVLTKSLPANGTLVMDMNVGEVRIVRSDEQKTISLAIEPRSFYDNAEIHSWVRQFDVAGDRASIDLKMPKHEGNNEGATVTISLPAQTDLKLDLGVGKISIKGIDGNKDVHVGIGDITVGVSDRDKYSEISTDLKIGDARDDVYQQHSGGFFPSTKHTSLQGGFKLRATAGIGNVNIVQE